MAGHARRARFLAEAAAVLAEKLDYQDTLQRLASLVVPDLAQWCAIDMLAPDGTIGASPSPTPTQPKGAGAES